jgi:rubrerythrin
MPQSKPAYLDLLNEICLQEGRAGVYLKAWADKSVDPELKECLRLVATREARHRDIFERRIRELGFAKQEGEDPSFAERLQVLGSDRSDAEKIKWNKGIADKQPKPTVRDRYEAAIEDEAVDSRTRSILRWFSEVEADSRDRINQMYARIEGKA